MSLYAEVRTRVGSLDVDVTLAATPGEVVAVVGPNGAGKSTLLRALAGLHPLDAGRVVLAGAVLDDPAAHVRADPAVRRIGFVPQQGLLFPHLSARDNVAFGLRSRGFRRGAAGREAQAWLDRLGVGALADRRPRQLSGGQAQRVAIARALAPRPRLLLLDEPLAALDTTTRADVRRLLRTHLTAYAEAPAIVVTHDPLEAVTLGDRLVVVEGGRVTQQGTAQEVTSAPRSPWIAALLGLNAYRGRTTVDGMVLDDGGGLVAADPLAAGQPALALVHPGAVALHRERPEGSPRNCWQGHVSELALLGGRVRVRIDATPAVVAEVTPAAAAALRLGDGGPVWVSVKATEVALTAL